MTWKINKTSKLRGLIRGCTCIHCYVLQFWGHYFSNKTSVAANSISLIIQRIEVRACGRNNSIFKYQAIPKVESVECISCVFVVWDLQLSYEANGSHQSGKGSPKKVTHFLGFDYS